MAKYRISGVWKDKDVVTAYAFHHVFEGGISRAEKKTKEQAIALLEDSKNTATTWLWNHSTGKWNIGETVSIIEVGNEKYLCSNRNNIITHHLCHLINLDLIVV